MLGIYSINVVHFVLIAGKSIRIDFLFFEMIVVHQSPAVVGSIMLCFEQPLSEKIFHKYSCYFY